MPLDCSNPNCGASVSVVIPCYNAQRWLAEAIESCLAQTYKNIEIIVVDDGSTDNSAEIARGFGANVALVQQPNRGGCAARNVGFARTTGDFIQFLDADDVLLPSKIERQVRWLIEHDADAVYGDWRHQYHDENGSFWLADPNISEDQHDVLAALLSGWWVSPAALLFRRKIVTTVGGWDETLAAAQDRDFFTRVAIETERIAYQPNCDSIYRRYGAVTISTGSRERYAFSHLAVLRKIEHLLKEQGRLELRYRECLARSYFYIARNIYPFDAALARETERHIRSLDPIFTPKERWVYRQCYNLFGFTRAEQLAAAKKSVSEFVGRW